MPPMEIRFDSVSHVIVQEKKEDQHDNSQIEKYLFGYLCSNKLKYKNPICFIAK